MAYDPKVENFALVKRAIRKSLVFDGRSSTSEFLIFYVFTLFASMLVGIPILFLVPADLAGPMIGVTNIVFTIPFAALFVRRLHDINWAGWWVAPYIITHFFVVSYNVKNDLPIFTNYNVSGWASGLLLLLMGFNLFVVFRSGDSDRNRYGPPQGWESENEGL